MDKDLTNKDHTTRLVSRGMGFVIYSGVIKVNEIQYSYILISNSENSIKCDIEIFEVHSLIGDDEPWLTSINSNAIIWHKIESEILKDFRR